MKPFIILRQLIFIPVFSIVFQSHSYGQGLGVRKQNGAMGVQTASVISFPEFTPIRGNYKILASFSPAPASPNEQIDQLKFPFDPVWGNKVLSLKPIFLKDVTVNDFTIPDPPANSSEQARAELNYLLALQHSRTAEDVRWSFYLSNNPETPSDIGRSIGLWVDPQNLPLTDSLMEHVEQDGDFFLWSLKFKYNRARPYMVEPKIHDLEESRAASFPSGHVTYAYIRAYIYQELAPEFTDFFAKKAYDMAFARQIMGVHYPSDCEASRIFARQFVTRLFQNAAFRQEFEQVKKEWASRAKESLQKERGALSKGR